MSRFVSLGFHAARVRINRISREESLGSGDSAVRVRVDACRKGKGKQVAARLYRFQVVCGDQQVGRRRLWIGSLG